MMIVTKVTFQRDCVVRSEPKDCVADTEDFYTKDKHRIEYEFRARGSNLSSGRLFQSYLRKY